MMNSVKIALELELDVEIGIPLTKENIDQIDELIAILPKDKVNLFLFTPHSGGRGITMLDSKITVADYERLSPTAKQYFNRKKNQTPVEWLNTDLPAAEHRVLTLSLLPSNIEHLERQSFEDTLRELEQADEDYHSLIPDFRSLLHMYANPKDKRLYSQKDLYLLYRRRYIADAQLNVLDITDERFSGSIRY